MKKFVLIITAVFIIGCLYSWRYYSLIKDLHGKRYFSDQLPKNNPAAALLLSHEQYLALGWVVQNGLKNLSFYFNNPIQKPPGAVRIGIFGGSRATFGGSIEKRDYTYPGLLQEKFKAQGFDQVEVINFGTAGYGMSQEYMLWEFLGQKYDLDYVVFTIQDNIKIRDNVFSGTMDLRNPLHGRYIMDHSILRFIPIAGDSRQKAYKLYQRGIPPLRYLLYDKYMPFSLKIFLPKSLHSRTNPFYYRHDRVKNQECFSIYTALLEKVARKAKHVIFVANESDSKEILKRIKSPNVQIFTAYQGNLIKQFIYYDEKYHSHTGSLGNALIADEFFSYLTGKDTWKGVSLQLKPCLQSFKAQGTRIGITGDFSDYDRLDIQAGNSTVAKMVYFNQEKHSQKSLDKGLPNDNKIKSFLMLPIVDMESISFLPLSFDLKEGQGVFLSFHTRWKERFFLIGTVHASNKIVGELEFTKVKLSTNDDEKKEVALILDDKDILKQIQGVTEGYIVINNSKVLRVKMSDGRLGIFGSRPRESVKLILEDQEKKLVFLSSGNSYFFDGDPFNPNGGTTDFVVTKKNGDRAISFCFQQFH